MSVLRRIVWTAVVAALLAVASVVFAVLDHDAVSVALGIAGITAATLASREAR